MPVKTGAPLAELAELLEGATDAAELLEGATDAAELLEGATEAAELDEPVLPQAAAVSWALFLPTPA